MPTQISIEATWAAQEWHHARMPLSAKNNLDELYGRHRLLLEEAARLQGEIDGLGDADPDADRAYILQVELRALEEEATHVAATISDVLERDLQR
ncbi:MAG: hypothetical protein M3O06_05265 [Pseudomonadota bacterium]|nr:hypothetical protein [Pseudomonadota bacterium]